jgi:hypothetical protein
MPRAAALPRCRCCRMCTHAHPTIHARQPRTRSRYTHTHTRARTFHHRHRQLLASVRATAAGCARVRRRRWEHGDAILGVRAVARRCRWWLRAGRRDCCRRWCRCAWQHLGLLGSKQQQQRHRQGACREVCRMHTPAPASGGRCVAAPAAADSMELGMHATGAPRERHTPCAPARLTCTRYVQHNAQEDCPCHGGHLRRKHPRRNRWRCRRNCRGWRLTKVGTDESSVLNK